MVRNVARVVLFAFGVFSLVAYFSSASGNYEPSLSTEYLAMPLGFVIVVGVPLQWVIVTKPEWIEKITKPLDR